MDRQEILDKFQTYTGIDNIELCWSYLEDHMWQFEEAVKAALPDQNIGSHDATASTSVQTDSLPATVTTTTSTETIELDDESSGRVRALHFRVEGVGSNAADLVVPASENVGALKRALVEARLTELLTLATHPDHAAAFGTDITPTTLAAGISIQVTNGGSTINLNDNSVALHTLHLPKYSSAVATFSGPSPADSSSLSFSVNVPDGSIVEVKLPASSSLPELLRRVAAGGVPVARQQWIAPDNGDTLERFVVAANRYCRPSATSSSRPPRLTSLGLRTGRPYILSVFDMGRDSCDGPLPTNGQTVLPDSGEDSAIRVSPEADYDIVDDEYFSDLPMETDDSDVTGQPLWGSPLITEAHVNDDPANAVAEFCERFLCRYVNDESGRPLPPSFHVGSLEEAIEATISAHSVTRRVPLLVYVHNDKSVASHVFCQQVLCSTALTAFLSEKSLALWPWDVTLTRARERLSGWLKLRLPVAATSVGNLRDDDYPLLLMLGKVSGRVDILCSISGRGTVTGYQPSPSSYDVSPFPTPSSSSSPGGSLSPDTIVAGLWQALTTFQELLAPELAAEDARLSRQRIREEQEAAFTASLQADRKKVEERLKAEEAQRLEENAKEQERITEEMREANARLTAAASLPPEPPAHDSPAARVFLDSDRGCLGIASLRFKMPGQNDSLTRRFAGTDTLRVVFTYLESVSYRMSDYKLLTTYPRRDLSNLDDHLTLSELKLVPQETLFLELR